MTLSITCNACGTAKPVDAYERLASGGRRGVCIACRQAANAAYRRAQREALCATPEQQALRAQKAARREALAAKKEAARAVAAEARIARRAAEVAEQEARQEAERLERAEREAVLHDELWTAMKRGRSTRALEAVKSERDDTHTIRLRMEKGFVSLAEFACRVEERRACSRAVHSCKTFEAVSAAVRVLEQPMPARDRIKDVGKRWHVSAPPKGPGLLSTLRGEEEEADADLFADAFGDWAPQWMGSMGFAERAA